MNIRKELLDAIDIGEGLREEFLLRLREFAKGTYLAGGCYKCGGEVDPINNASIFQYINSYGHWESILNDNLHLEPVADEDGVIDCPGSPSRWQNISGVPDERPEYRDNFKGQDPIYMAIWKLMQILDDVEPEGKRG